MKILYVGHLDPGQTCRMRRDELAGLGHEIVDYNTEAPWQNTSWFGKHLQKRVYFGSVIDQINRNVLRLAEQHRPDWFWGDKQEYLRPQTLQRLRTLGIKSVHFTPDPYFTLTWKRTRLMDRCMPLFDTVITSKTYELERYKKVCKHVIYMPLGFSERVHRQLETVDTKPGGKYYTPLGFIGGWEPRREEYLSKLVAAGGQLKIWGYAWEHLTDGRWTMRRAYRLKVNAGNAKFRIARNPALAACWQSGEIYGDTYAQAQTGSQVSIGFLRFVCPDQHTTRTFEIPACGSMLLADRTPEHQEFFEEGKEAEFFSSVDEMVEKALYYQEHEDKRQAIAQAGMRRCHDSGYSYRARLQKVLAELS
jgi:spore maturation protein CgeB